jgi:integrase
MSVYRQRGSKVYWVDFEFNGERIRFSSKSRSKKVAIQAEKAHRRRLEEGYNGIKRPDPPKTFAAAAKDFVDVCGPNLAESTLDKIKREIDHLDPLIGKKLLPDITSKDVQDIVKARRATGASNRYTNMTIEALRRILRRNGQWEHLRKDYKKLKEPKCVGMALSHKEEETLLRECRRSSSRILILAVTLGIYTGMRRGEILSLQWCQINLKKAFLKVGKSKTEYGEGRVIPLIGAALKAILAWAMRFPNRKPEDYVVPKERYASKVGKVYHHDPTKPIGAWRTAWETARRRAGVQLRFHDLRHTTVTRLLEAGRTIEQIAPIMGWSGQTMYEMVKIYSEWSIEAKRKTMSGLVAKRRARRKTNRRNSTKVK